MSMKSAHNIVLTSILIVVTFLLLFVLAFSPAQAQQVTKTIPADGFTKISTYFKPVNTATFNAPTLNYNEKVVGVYAYMHDGSTSWSFTPYVKFTDGSEITDLKGECGINDNPARFGYGKYDVCTSGQDQATKHYWTLGAGETRKIQSIRFFFDNDANKPDQVLSFEKLEWLIAIDNTATPTPKPTPTPVITGSVTPKPSQNPTPVPTPALCNIVDRRYVQDPSFQSKTYNYNERPELSYTAPAVGANERVIGVDVMMNDKGDDWDYRIVGNLKNGGSFGTNDMTGPCDQFNPMLGPDWEDVCSGKTNPVTGKVDSHEIVLKNGNNPISSVKVSFGTKEQEGRLFYTGFAWIIGTCQPQTPPPTVTQSVTPKVTPTTTPPVTNACTLKSSNYVPDKNFSTMNINTEGQKVTFTAPAAPANQRVLGVNVIMNDNTTNWAYKAAISLSTGQTVGSSGITKPCGIASSLGPDWIDVCTKGAHPITGKIDAHELRLQDTSQQVTKVEIEFRKFKASNSPVKIYGLEWIIGDCNAGTPTVGECQVVPSVPNPAGGIADGQTRVSAVDKYKLSWTKPEIKNTECSFVNTEIYFTTKGADGSCNYPAQPLATINDINQTELEINDFAKYGNYLLNWNRDYCWKVKNNVQKLKVTEVISNSQTKMRKHDAQSVAQIPYWLKFSGVADNSASWVAANPVYESRWNVCTVASAPWRPSGVDPNVPASCFNINSFQFMNPNGDENVFPRIIQSSTSVNRPYGDRDAFRRKFVMPQNIVVKKLTLYSASDSVASYWINEKGVNNKTGSLINNNVCNSSTDAGSNRGIYKLDLDPGFIVPGNNIIAGNIVNADECGKPSPMGVQFLLKAEYADLADQSSRTTVESTNFTFATNKNPVFIRNGISYDPNFKNDTAIEGNINVGTVKCSFNTGCDLYPSQTAPVCFSGNTKSGKADNPVTFWFEFKDPDNNATINENHKHYFVFTKQSDKIDNRTNLSDFNGGILHAADRDFVIEYDLNQIALRGQQSTMIKVLNFGKFEDPQTKAIRVFYTIEFLEGFQTDIYTVNSMFESLAQGTTQTAILADNMNWQKLNQSPQFWTDSRIVTQRGAWGVDLEIPVVEVPEIRVSGVNEFGVNWSVKESGLIGDVTLGCYTKQTTIPLNYISPDSPFGINVTGKKENPTQCVSNNDKTNFIGLLNDGKPDNNKYSSKYIIGDYKKFGNLGTIITATDRACNVSDPQNSEANEVQDNWVSTRQGTTFVESGMTNDRVVTKLGEEKKEKTYFTYDFSGTQKKLFEKATDDVTNLSTNFLGINSGSLKGNTSYTREEISGYKDANNVPLISGDIPATVDSWFKYFEYVQNQKSRASKSVSGQTVNDISQLTCGANEVCIYNNLKLAAGNGKNLCDQSKVVFVKGTLAIEDELLNKDDKSACLFVVDGNVEIRNTKPKKDRDGIELSPYDVIEAYIISSGNVIITEDQQLLGGAKGYGDGIFVRGGIVAKNFENKRNLGIRNTLQPPALMVYDPRYLYLLRDEISTRLIQVRETDFTSDVTPTP